WADLLFLFHRRRSVMAVMNLQSLVLRLSRVAGDVGSGLERAEINPTVQQPPALPLSVTRHFSRGTMRTDSDPMTRYAGAKECGAGYTALRAGRLAGLAGVLVRRSPAITAGQTILSRWSLAVGRLRPVGVWCRGRSMPLTHATPGGT